MSGENASLGGSATKQEYYQSFPVPEQPGQDKDTWEVAVHEPAGRLYLLRLA
jgi:hypothetical protein